MADNSGDGRVVSWPNDKWEAAIGIAAITIPRQSWGEGQWVCTVTANAKPTSGYYEQSKNELFGDLLAENGVYTASVTSWTNTGTSIALNAGLDILANSVDAYDDMYERTPPLWC